MDNKSERSVKALTKAEQLYEASKEHLEGTVLYQKGEMSWLDLMELGQVLRHTIEDYFSSTHCSCGACARFRERTYNQKRGITMKDATHDS